MNLRVVPLDRAHDRARFSCGDKDLDRYFQEQIQQDAKRLIASPFVALCEETIAGFMTLSSASIPLLDLDAATAKRLPRYPVLPAVRLGRLAVDQNFQGKGVGAFLLAEAIARALRSEIAGFALVVDAKNENAAHFYEHFGFVRFSASRKALFLPLATAKKAFAG